MEVLAKIKQPAGIRLTPFVLGLLCFLLPFIQVSCQGKKVLQLTGVQLITGAEVREPFTDQVDHIPAEPAAIVALIALCVGCSLAFSSRRFHVQWSAACGAIATISLLFIKIKLDDAATRDAAVTPFVAELLAGYWVTAALSLTAATACLAGALERQHTLKPDPQDPKPQS